MVHSTIRGSADSARRPSKVEQRLPRGRHKLRPEEVVASQRRRIFSAMAAATAVKGYAATTVADILEVAGVSRETFYEQFDSKLDCFEQAFDDASNILFAQIEPAAAGEGTRAERFDRLLGVYLDALASQPALARLCLVEVYAAGPALVRRRTALQQRFAQGLEQLLDARDPEGRFACRALVASVSSMATSLLAAGDAGGLRKLQKPFAGLVGRALSGVPAPPGGARP